MTDIRVTNASIEIEDEDTETYLRVTNAAIDIEDNDAVTYLRVTNAAIMIESAYQVAPDSCYHIHTAESPDIEIINGVMLRTSGLIAYGDFTRGSLTYLSRPDEAGTSITDELTLGCWCWFDEESTDAATGLICKWLEAGNLRSYALFKDASNKFTFIVSDDGTNEYSIDDGGVNYAEDTWFYVVGRFTPNNEMALFVNGTWYLDNIGIPAAIFDSTEALDFGRKNHTDYLDGRMSDAFISGCSVPTRFIETMFAHSRAMFMAR
jgi:hypothetical protein